jgi:hypothetical protein
MKEREWKGEEGRNENMEKSTQVSELEVVRRRLSGCR